MTATDTVREVGAPAAPTAPGAPARASAWVAVVAVVLALLTVPGGTGLLPPGAVATLASGAAQVMAGDAWVTLELGGAVRDGDVVRTRGSRAELTTADGTVRLAGDTRALLEAGSVQLERGAVLFEDTVRWGATVDLVTVDGEGTWRVDAVASPRVAVYAGALTVSDGARQLEVESLWQAPLVDAGLATDVEPLRYLAADPWDRRLLPEAIATDRFLAGLRNSLSLRYGDAPRRPDFYADFGVADADSGATLAALAPRRVDDRIGPPAGVLIGALLVDLVASRAGLSRGQASDRVVDLRRQGAAWGLVTVSFDLTADDVQAAADGALDRRAEAEEQDSATPVVADTPPASADTGSATAGGPDGAPAGRTAGSATGDDDPNPDGPDGQGGGQDGGSDGGGQPDADDDPDEPTDEPTDEIDDAVDEVRELLPDPDDALPDPDEAPPDPGQDPGDGLAGDGLVGGVGDVLSR